MLNQFADLTIVLTAVPLGIVFGFPETERQDAFRFRHQDNLIHKTRLRLQGRQDFLMQGIANLAGLSRLGFDFDDANEHGRYSFPQ